MGASRATVLRIAGNVALDAGLGAVPIIGDIFDFAWKANLRNVALLERHLAARGRGERADSWVLGLAICGVCVMVLALLALGILLTVWTFRALASGDEQGPPLIAFGSGAHHGAPSDRHRAR